MERHTIKNLIRYGSMALLALIIVSYSLYQARNLIAGPVITITSPSNGASFDHSRIEIEGIAKNVNVISVNDRPIFIDEQGHFKEIELLSPGDNIITLKAKDKFGRSTQRTLEIVYKTSS